MKITSTTFEISAASSSQFPNPTVPEIVFAGRSNVGKSSLLNSIAGKKNLAKVSGTPGKTRLINFFLINDNFRFVDLPGYGFAHVSMQERHRWRTLIESYFESERRIALVVVLIDARLPAQTLDKQMIEWLMSLQQSIQIVLTKIDKLKQSERAKQIKNLLKTFEQIGCFSKHIPFSSVTGEGKIELLKRLDEAILN